MQELSANSLKLKAKTHKKLIHVVKVMILGRRSTLGTCQTRRGSHLITLAPEVGDLGKESLSRTITLIVNTKSLKQGVA